MSHPDTSVWLGPALAAVFATSMFQGMAGFGMALLCIPIISSLTDPKMAIECMTIASLGTTALIAFAYRAHWDLKRAAWLGIPLLIGTPLGVYLLKILSNEQIKCGVGAIMLATSVQYFIELYLDKRKAAAALREPKTDLTSDDQAAAADYSRPMCVTVGGISGVLGGATGMTGPVLANYLSRTGIERGAFKVTLNLIFTASAAWRASLFLGRGMMTGDVLKISLLFVPVAIAGTVIGMKLDRRIPAQHFIPLVQVILLGLGTWFLWSSWHAPAHS